MRRNKDRENQLMRDRQAAVEVLIKKCARQVIEKNRKVFDELAKY